MMPSPRRLVIGSGFVLLGLLILLGALVAEDRAPAIGLAAIRFSERLIADKYDYPYGLAAADLDGDGDLDLTSVDIRDKIKPLGMQRSSLFWFQNDGRGTFRRHVIREGEQGWFERHAAGDINGDAKPDVAVVNNQPDVDVGYDPPGRTPQAHVVWFANNDRPAAGPWKRYVITTKCPRAYDVVLVDLDGDGLLDAAVSGYTNNFVSWYKNPGKDGWDREWTQTKIDEKMPEARNIRVGDFNSDGRADLVCTSFGYPNVPLDVTDGSVHGSSVVWYENPGRAATRSWRKHIIDDRSRAPVHGHGVDMDRDGDTDVVMALGMGKEWAPDDAQQVVWYENVGRAGKGMATVPGEGTSSSGTGDGLQWTKHKIGTLTSAFEAVAADLDGDGDMDVVATAWAKGDRVAWFENPGDPRGPWTTHVVRDKWYAANQVIVADLNGDKRPDLAATADAGSGRVDGAKELRWWQNEASAGRRPGQ